MMMPSINAIWIAPRALRSSASSPVSWVSVKTKTRSKNSSSVLTRTAGSAARPCCRASDTRTV
jgi:hypothetical protein